jgi:hypothetical protein
MIGSFIAATVIGFVGLLVLMSLGLIVSELVITPLALLVAGVFVALAAGWTGTLLATDGTRTQLGAVVARTEVTAAVLAIALLALMGLQITIFGRLIYLIVACSVLLALGASIETGRNRDATQSRHHDVRLTLTLLAAAVVAVPLVIWVASVFGLTGA